MKILSTMKKFIRDIAYAIYPTTPIQFLMKLYVRWLLRTAQKKQTKSPDKRVGRLSNPEMFRGLTASLIFSRTHWNPHHIHHKIGTGRMQQEIFTGLQELGFDTEFAGGEDRTYSKRIKEADLVIAIPSALAKIGEKVQGLKVLLPCNTHILVRTARLIGSSRKWHLPCEYYPWMPTHLKAYSEADYLLIAENDQGIDNFVRNGITRERIKRFNNCVDEDIWVPGHSKRDVFTFVCWTASAGLRKGFPALVKAWQKWLNNQNAELHVFGMPTATSDVMFNGRRPGNPSPALYLHLNIFPAQDPNVIEFLGASHVGILPTLEDAQPSSLLEMASCGLAIITTRESGVYFSDDFCKYIAADSVKGLVEAFQYWYENRGYVAEAGNKARFYIKQNHTWPHLQKRLREIIRDIFGGG
jgi:glycosyltransferase involved in cell wall biosynthesis